MNAIHRLARCSVALLVLSATPLSGQDAPSPADVLGRALGERFTDAASVERYAEALASASARVQLVRYGATPEGRALQLLVLASETNHGRLPSVLAANARLLDPGLTPADAASVARANPAIVWFTYGVHGDESASTEAALWTAWDLATGGNGSAGILDSLIVVIDPVANPDGRDRYVRWYEGVGAIPPNPEPASREHAPPWPGGRYNHYLFDLNRDWTWATQLETQARLVEWARWNPQVHVDFHEMGYNSTYFFFPAAEPLNPVYPDYTVRWAEHFGRANAAEFDRRRWLYYTGETFDMFYPGFGDSWPSLVGAIGMTYEQAGSGRAGLTVRRDDGTHLTLAERAEHHRVAGLTTLRAAAGRKSELLSEFAGFHRTQGEGQPDVLLVPGPDSGALARLVELLHVQGIRVERAARSFRASAGPHPGFDAREEFPVGTLRVRARQPRGRLAVTLLQPETLLPEGVVNTYDITAWSLPYAFGIEAHTAEETDGGDFRPVPAVVARQEESPAVPAYGWLVPPSFEVAGALYRYVAAAGRAFALRTPVEMRGASWPAGTVFVPADSGAARRLTEVGLSPHAHPVGSGLTDSGRDLGTGSALALTAPRVGLMVGSGLRATSVGAVWHLLEVRAGIPFDALDVESTRASAFAGYDVLVIPAGDADRALRDVRGALADWVEAGGTLVSLGSSSRWVAEELADVTLRGADTGEAPEEERRRMALRTREQRRSDAWDDAVTGVILPLTVDEGHPLTWGTGRGNAGSGRFVLHLEDGSFEPGPSFETVGWFGEPLEAVSGAVSGRKLRQMASSGWLVVAKKGRGKVVLFADDPLFRLMWPASFVMFTNALLYGPSFR